ncbi:MAG: 5-formyltetrahydrofolate cyclo-ligase [Alphaproteobacteria bacterium]|nr:MAG: 5-formyltetrahydrofolate cyclo-ligase [Alphaproteobacteria bacterium]
MTAADLEADKADARMLMRAERNAIEVGDAALKLIENFPLELATLSPVAGYWPVGGEIDGRPLLAALAKAGRTVALPRMGSRAGPARFLAWRGGEALTADAFGVPSPPATGADLSPRLILTPLLAFDRAGRRLGQGGGHYDRIISLYRAHGAVAVGLAYAEQEMGVVPTGPHDAHLDWVITPKEAIKCVRGEGLRGRSG